PRRGPGPRPRPHALSPRSPKVQQSTWGVPGRLYYPSESRRTGGRLRRGRLAASLLGICAAACGGPRFPKEITFDGNRLPRATTWSRGKISGALFVPPGEAPASASLQVGVLVSREHATGLALSQWVMGEYHASRT